jgi:hypothetical protein
MLPDHEAEAVERGAREEGITLSDYVATALRVARRGPHSQELVQEAQELSTQQGVDFEGTRHAMLRAFQKHRVMRAGLDARYDRESSHLWREQADRFTHVPDRVKNARELLKMATFALEEIEGAFLDVLDEKYVSSPNSAYQRDKQSKGFGRWVFDCLALSDKFLVPTPQDIDVRILTICGAIYATEKALTSFNDLFRDYDSPLFWPR